MEEAIKVKVLNDHRGDIVVTSDIASEETGNELIKQLKISMTTLKSHYINEDSGTVNYEKMLESTEFSDYRR